MPPDKPILRYVVDGQGREVTHLVTCPTCDFVITLQDCKIFALVITQIIIAML